MNDDLRQISDWARRKKFDLSPEKSTVTLFSSDPHQVNYHPQVFLDGSLIPLAKNPKILGVTLDPMFTFGPHSKTVVDKVSTRLKILKSLAGTDWGHSKEDLNLTYKMLGSSVINYAAARGSDLLSQPETIQLGEDSAGAKSMSQSCDRCPFSSIRGASAPRNPDSSSGRSP